jgi:lysophospholipase L1-like esterase
MLHPIGAMVSVAVGGIWFRLFEWPFLTMSRRETEQHGVSRGNYKKLKWFVSIGVVLLIIIFSSFWILRASYENRLRQQLWPMAMPEISPASSWSTNSSPTVLLLGDSRMAQWNLPQLSGWRVVNAGKGGMTTGQLRLCAPKLLEEFHPDAVVLEAGINDLKFLGLRPEMDSQIVSLASDNLNAAVRECLKRHCKIILLETWPPDKPDLARRLVWNAKIPKAVDQLNEKLRLLDGIEGNVHVVDLFGKADIKIKEDLYRDTLHFKPEVYESLTPSLQLELDLILQR